MAPLPEGTPIVCLQCGGSMTLQADLVAHCRYCGARAELPRDELGRALEIKRRLAEAEKHATQLRGVDVALAGIFEDPKAFLRVAGVYVVFLLLIVAMSASQFVSYVLPRVGKASSRVIFTMVAGQLLSPLIIFGIVTSLGIGLTNGRSHYRKLLRPLLMARPGRDSISFACRACGGNLPPTRSADVRCQYCNTLNLVPKELHGAHAAALLQRSEELRGQVRGVNVTTMSIASHMRRAFLITAGCIVLLVVGLQILAQNL